MRVAFRVDSSLDIGIGHVMRCLTLGNAIRDRGADSLFICREHRGNLCDHIATEGFAVARLPIGPSVRDPTTQGSLQPADAEWLGASWEEDANQTRQVLEKWGASDWLVVDQYALDSNWESAMRSNTGRIMVIDDLADRRHECDLLLDQNYYESLENRYHGLVPDHCVTLLGPAHALLRSEFVNGRRRLAPRTGSVHRVLVYFGGSDMTNQTLQVAKAVPLLGRPDITFDFVLSATNPHRSAIQELCAGLPNTIVHLQASNMADLMLAADLAIGAGGTSMWERCYVGLPAITVVLAANQERTTEAVAGAGAIKYLGRAQRLRPDDYARAVAELSGNPSVLRKISAACLSLMPLAGDTVPEAMYCHDFPPRTTNTLAVR